jgi:hypothetical protein
MARSEGSSHGSTDAARTPSSKPTQQRRIASTAPGAATVGHQAGHRDVERRCYTVLQVVFESKGLQPGDHFREEACVYVCARLCVGGACVCVCVAVGVHSHAHTTLGPRVKTRRFQTSGFQLESTFTRAPTEGTRSRRRWRQRRRRPASSRRSTSCSWCASVRECNHSSAYTPQWCASCAFEEVGEGGAGLDVWLSYFDSASD